MNITYDTSYRLLMFHNCLHLVFAPIVIVSGSPIVTVSVIDISIYVPFGAVNFYLKYKFKRKSTENMPYLFLLQILMSTVHEKTCQFPLRDR